MVHSTRRARAYFLLYWSPRTMLRNASIRALCVRYRQTVFVLSVQCALRVVLLRPEHTLRPGDAIFQTGEYPQNVERQRRIERSYILSAMRYSLCLNQLS